MLPEEMHAALRRLARRRGVPLAALVRQALSDAVENERRAPSFIGAVAVQGATATATVAAKAPISPFRTDAPDTQELQRLRQLADNRAGELRNR